jgi:two-component system sensor kinase FixL
VESTVTATLEALPFPCGVRKLAGDDVIHVHDNTASARFYGRTVSQMRGLSGRELGLSPSRIRACVVSLNEARRQRSIVRHRARHDTAGGTCELIYHVAPLSFDASRFICAIEDVTDVNRLEREAAHAERLAAIGTLTAALVHDMASPATIALGRVENCLRAVDVAEAGAALAELPSLRRDLLAARESLAHLTGVLRTVRSYTELNSNSALGSCDLNAIVDSALQIAGADLRASAELTFTRGAIPPVRGNAVQLGQVILNLASNAARAASLHRPPATARVVIHTELGSDGRIKLEVIDNGAGLAISADRLFQPFATRYPKEGGSGLGLFISKRIIESFGGTIEIGNRSGRSSGAVATVLLLPHRNTD